MTCALTCVPNAQGGQQARRALILELRSALESEVKLSQDVDWDDLRCLLDLSCAALIDHNRPEDCSEFVEWFAPMVHRLFHKALGNALISEEDWFKDQELMIQDLASVGWECYTPVAREIVRTWCHGLLSRAPEVRVAARGVSADKDRVRVLLGSASNICGHLGSICYLRGDVDTALEEYAESMRLRRRVTEEVGTPDALNSWIWSTHLTASYLVDLGRHSEALSLLEEVQARAEDLESSCDGDLNILDTSAAYHETRAKACAALGRADDAQRSAEKAAETRARIEELSDDADGDETKS